MVTQQPCLTARALGCGPRTTSFAAAVVKAGETWPRTAEVYCHRADGWPEDAEIVERVPVKACTARGPAVDLVLDGREAILWRTARTDRNARPAYGP